MLSHSLLLTSYLVMALGGYELQVTIHSFDNPENRCAERSCDQRCCELSCPSKCDYYFSLCQRPAGTPVSYVPNQNQGNCSIRVTSYQKSNGSNVTFTHSVFNISNPIAFSGELWPNDGVQLFLEIIDDDIYTDDELIDRFAINVSTPVGSTTERTTYPGIFGFATIDMNFTIVCTENFYGPNCNTCEPGYTGSNCTTDIDDCTNVECNNGQCVNETASFLCVCNTGFTGEFCQIQRDGYELQVIIHSYDNPERKCADSRCEDCCELQCSESPVCDYFFSICQRPLGTPVSGLRGVNQGNCSAANTVPQTNNGSSNDPIMLSFTGLVWPPRGVQLYIELIDHEFLQTNDELVDRFAIDVTIPVGEATERTTYLGIFGFATIDLNFRLSCTEDFSGPNCDQLCPNNSNCTIKVFMTSSTESEPPKSDGRVGRSAIIVVTVIIASLLVIIIVVSMIILAVKFKSKKGAKNIPMRPNLGHHKTLEPTRNATYRSQSDTESTIASPRASLKTFNLTSNITYQSESNFLGAADSPRASLSQNAIQGSLDESTNVYELDDSNVYELDDCYVQPGNKEVEVNNLLMKLGITLIDNDSVQLLEVLGSGAFGMVHRGMWFRTTGDKSTQPVEKEVAVKSIKNVDEEENCKFLQEAAIMGQFSHANIIHMYGIIRIQRGIKIVLEYLHQGDLRNFLRNFDCNSSGQYESMKFTSRLLSYSRHIANGMSYLSNKKFVHRDLAARNVLMTNTEVCKIADFGLSRELQSEDYYHSRGLKIPVKWTALEALNYRNYTSASDVWSFGVVLYEIWSLGKEPYHDLDINEVISKLNSGYRMPPPPGCPRYIYKMMIKCWNPKPSERPSFSCLAANLSIPDYIILQKDDAVSEEGMIIGSPLSFGSKLYNDLQMKFINM